MSREFKPGDVAMVAYDGQPERLMLRAEVERVDGPRPCWIDHAYRIFADQNRVQSVRPLVVIDPEDREQVERFVRSYFTEWEKSPDAHRIALPGETMPLQSHADAAQAALRSLIALPKPEEPRGLGAVVEDAEGVRWVRAGKTIGDPADDWRCIEGKRVGWWSDWRNIAAVRVLANGVSE